MPRTPFLVIALVAATLPHGSTHAQIPPETPGKELAKASFEVASVRENHLSQREALRSFFRMDPSGHFEATWATLRPLIVLAYSVRANQIVDAPEWIDKDRFDIVAKAPDGFELGHTRAMMRKLLEDRFRLVVRREMRRMPVYSLEWAGSSRRKLGPGIRPPSSVCDESFVPRASTTPAAGAQAAPADQSKCGPVWGFGIGWIFVRRGPLSSFITFLEGETDRPVIDKTGLTGIYDVDVKWSPEPRRDFAKVPGAGPDLGSGPSIYTAVREQLGLKLEPINGDREVLAVERLERPTPN